MTSRQSILIVDINQRNIELLSKFLEKEGYHTIGARNLEEFDNVLVGNIGKIGLALIDIAGFNSGIWDRCKQIHEKQISLIIISHKQDSVVMSKSISHGAHGVLVKPLVSKELINMIKNLLED